MWHLPPVNDLTLRVAINNNNNKKRMTVTMTSLCAFSWKKYCNLMNFFFPRNHQKDTPKKGKKNLSFGDVTQIERSKYLGHFCDFLRQCLPFFLCDLSFRDPRKSPRPPLHLKNGPNMPLTTRKPRGVHCFKFWRCLTIF